MRSRLGAIGQRPNLLMGVGALVALAITVSACGSSATATPVPPTATQKPAATPTVVPQNTQAPATPTPVSTATLAPPTPTPSGPTPRVGGIMNLKLSDTFRNWDSRSAGGSGTVFATMQNVLNNLVYIQADDPSKYLPDLAERWSLSPDGKTWTYFLRRDVRWQDGAPFTSKDVLFTLDKYINPVEPGLTFHKNRLSAVGAFTAPDDYTVNITLKGPSAFFFTSMATTSALIYPSHVPFKGTEWTDKPVGTGPYHLDSYSEIDGYKFSKNPTYYKKDARGTQLPYLDGFQYFIIKDPTLGQSAFTTGRLDYLGIAGSDLAPQQVKVLQGRYPNADYTIVRATAPDTIGLNQRPPMNDIRVRQALHIVMDRKTANDVALLGLGYYPQGLLVPEGAKGQWALPDSELLKLPGWREPKDQDVAMAKELIKRSGIDPSKYDLRIISLNASPYIELAQVVLEDWAKLGFRGHFDGMTTSDNRAEAIKGNFDGYMIVYGQSSDDPNDVLTAHIITGGSDNYGKWSFQEIDALAAQQDQQVDPAKRRALLWDMQRKLYDLAYELPGLYTGRGFAKQKYLEGMYMNRNFSLSSAIRFDGVWLNK